MKRLRLNLRIEVTQQKGRFKLNTLNPLQKKPNIKWILLVSGLLGVHSIAVTEEMKYDEYLSRLEQARTREANALPRIAQLEATIADLRVQINSVKEQVESSWQAMLNKVGITQQQYDDFANRLEQLNREVANISRLYSGDTKAWKAALARAETTLKELKSSPIAVFPRLKAAFDAISLELENSRRELMGSGTTSNSSGSSDSYTVVERDCLWNISSKPDVYNDPIRWIDLYNANTDKIKDPDLIRPGQVLKVPR